MQSQVHSRHLSALWNVIIIHHRVAIIILHVGYQSCYKNPKVKIQCFGGNEDQQVENDLGKSTTITAKLRIVERITSSFRNM
eukprot:scaffold103442_cov52-Attheya_sp.AAC.2